MCTVSFIPLEAGKFILTSNRDEAIERGLASAPKIIEKETYRIVCPVDPLANGTWIAAADYGDVICLLNGAFGRHKRQLPYRMSRGLVVLDYFKTGHPQNFAQEYDLTHIEPFTLAMVHRGRTTEVFELKWDGEKKYFSQLNADDFHLWSSPTLYSDEMAAMKKDSFKKMLQEETTTSSERIMDLHNFFLYEDWLKPPERVPVVSTLSITSVEAGSQNLTMRYRDLVRKEKEIVELDLHEAR